MGGQDDVPLNATSHIQTLLPARTSLIRKRVTKNSFVGKNQYLVHSSPVPCRRTGWRGGPVVLIILKGMSLPEWDLEFWREMQIVFLKQ